MGSEPQLCIQWLCCLSSFCELPQPWGSYLCKENSTPSTVSGVKLMLMMSVGALGLMSCLPALVAGCSWVLPVAPCEWEPAGAQRWSRCPRLRVWALSCPSVP